MSDNTSELLQDCETLMLDMDGTLLDLAFDNHFWLQTVPGEYARRREMPEVAARQELYKTMKRLQGTLDWYCLDHWSELLDLDIAGMHRDENHRIGYLPGAEDFLNSLADSEMRVLLVTNSHRTTLDIKHDVTGVKRHFDEIYTSHDAGHPKEDQPFWLSLAEQEDFDLATTVFVDDNLSVLASAEKFGIANVVAVTRPDTTAPAQDAGAYQSVAGVAELTLR